MSENLNALYQSLDKRVGGPAFATNYGFISRKNNADSDGARRADQWV
jgi:hypothetical protein